MHASRRDAMCGKDSSSTPKSRDLVRTSAALWIWYLPIVVVIVGSILSTSVWNGHRLLATLTGVLLTLATAWIGVACYLNGRRCGRTHCKIDGILLPLLSLAGVLNLLGVTSFGWNVYSDAFWIIVFISFVPECLGMTYTHTQSRGVTTPLPLPTVEAERKQQET
jgi:hypothetical protein